MNRKAFLQKAALASLAAAGVSTLKAASRQQETVSYITRYDLVWKGQEATFEFNVIDSKFFDRSRYSKYEITVKVTLGEYEHKDSANSESYHKYRRSGIKVIDDIPIFKYTLVSKTPKLVASLGKNIYFVDREYPDGLVMKFDEGKRADLLLVEEEEKACFLTTACTAARGLPDDCAELTTLRAFRDTILKPTDQGETLVSNYYKIAPTIVQRVNERTNANDIWNEVYSQLVIPTKYLIDDGKDTEAIVHYKEYVLAMQEVFTS